MTMTCRLSFRMILTSFAYWFVQGGAAAGAHHPPDQVHGDLHGEELLHGDEDHENGHDLHHYHLPYSSPTIIVALHLKSYTQSFQAQTCGRAYSRIHLAGLYTLSCRHSSHLAGSHGLIQQTCTTILKAYISPACEPTAARSQISITLKWNNLVWSDHRVARACRDI